MVRREPRVARLAQARLVPLARRHAADRPPNNWPAAFGGGPAWTWDEATEQWYLHTFLPQQPDLNWDNPEVVEAMHDVLRFWLDRGVDGFRADVVHLIGKDPALPDIPETDIVGSHLDVVGTHDYQGTHALLRGIRAVLDEYPGDRMMVGEVNLTRTELIAPYLGDSDELHLAFDFESLTVPWEAGAWRARIAHVEDGHGRALADVGLLQPRPAAHAHAPGRLGGARPRRRRCCCSRCAARRSSTPARSSAWRTRTCRPSASSIPAGATAAARRSRGRPTADHGWPADPWLPWPPEPGARSVEAQRADPGSMLHLARAVLALRRGVARPAPRRRSTLLDDAPDGVLAYERADGDDRRRVWVNFAGAPVALPEGWVVELATAGAGDGLPPDAAAVLRPARLVRSRSRRCRRRLRACIADGTGVRHAALLAEGPCGVPSRPCGEVHERATPTSARGAGGRSTAATPPSMMPSGAAQRLGRRRIRREERLDRQLGHRDVDRGAEGRHRAEEAQLAVAGAEDERDEDLAPGAVVGVGVRAGRGSR